MHFLASLFLGANNKNVFLKQGWKDHVVQIRIPDFDLKMGWGGKAKLGGGEGLSLAWSRLNLK